MSGLSLLACSGEAELRVMPCIFHRTLTHHGAPDWRLLSTRVLAFQSKALKSAGLRDQLTSDSKNPPAGCEKNGPLPSSELTSFVSSSSDNHFHNLKDKISRMKFYLRHRDIAHLRFHSYSHGT